MPKEAVFQELKVSWSVQAIGEAAGQVWSTLNRTGKTSLTTVEREAGAPISLTHMALGWLAREGKIQLQQDKRTTIVWLTE